MNKEKYPIGFIFLLVLGYLAWDLYDFYNSNASALGLKKNEFTVLQGEVQKLRVRLREVEDFKKSLEVKAQEIRQLTLDLEQTRAVLDDKEDVATFMRLILTEAQRSGVVVTSLKPGEQIKLEYVVQQAYDMTLGGAYAQILNFIDGLSKLQKIISIQNYSLKPVSKGNQRFVDLDGSFQFRSYRYLGSQADEIGHKSSLSSTPHAVPSPVPSASPVAAVGGTR